MVKIAVVGCGLLGLKIAGELAYHGHYVRVNDSITETLNSVYDRLEEDKGELKQQGLMNHVEFTGCVYSFGKLEDAVREVEFVFEAIPDDLEKKQDLLDKISSFCAEETIIATSSLYCDVTRIAERAHRQERVIGVRFLYPVYSIPEVEIRMGEFTSLRTLENVQQFMHRMGKTVFFRSGNIPLILNQLQREDRLKGSDNNMTG